MMSGPCGAGKSDVQRRTIGLLVHIDETGWFEKWPGADNLRVDRPVGEGVRRAGDPSLWCAQLMAGVE